MTLNHPVVFLFLGAVLVLLSLERLRPIRRQIFFFATLIFVSLEFKPSPRSMLFLMAFIAVHFAVLQLMLRFKLPAARRAIYYTWLLLAIVTFLVVKQYTWLIGAAWGGGRLPIDIYTIGLSFLIFRQIHTAIEVRDDVLKRMGLVDYLSYSLAFWTFIAGPIQRFDEFHGEFHRLEAPDGGASQEEVLLGLNRAMFGYLKMFVLAAPFHDWARVETFTRHTNLGHLTLFLLAFPLYIYLNFSGYCDIVVGFARALGFKLSENFNHPYLARNMVDFWNRWHITLSAFFRDYMYLPTYMSLRKRIPSLLAMAVTSIWSFLIMGIWHGETAMFALFGLAHAIGVVVVNLYAELLKKVLTREQLKSYRQARLIHLGAVLLCQSYIVLTFLPFAYSWQQLSEFYRCLFQMAT